MKLKRAIGISVVVYIASLLIGGVVAAMMGIDPTTTTEISPAMWIAGAVAAVVLSALGALWYFRSAEVATSASEGARFGVTEVVVGFVLDMVVALPAVIADARFFDQVLAYYQQPWFWVTLVLVVLAPVAVGSLRKNQTTVSSPTGPAR